MPIPNQPGNPPPPGGGGGGGGGSPYTPPGGGGGGDNTPAPSGGGTAPAPPSGSSGSSGAAPSQAALHAWTMLLSQLGIRMSQNMHNLIQHAIQGGWTQSEFMWNLRKTPEYLDIFPGIFNPNGTMKMTEAQYLSQEKAYQQIADLAGIHLNQENQALLFEGDTSSTEFQQRAAFISRWRENPEAFEQFAAAAKAQGLIKGKFTIKDAMHLSLGTAPKEWYKLLEEAGTRTAAVQAGFDITKHAKLAGYLGLSRQQILAIDRAVPGLGGEAAMAGSFQELAQRFRTLLPEGNITGFAVTKDDLIQLEFGGPRQAQVAETVGRILAAVKAREEPLAQATFASTGQGPKVYGTGTQSRPSS